MLRHPGKIALVFVLIGILLYFLFDIVPSDVRASKEFSNSGKESNSIEFLDTSELEPNQKAELDELTKSLDIQNEPNSKIEIYRKISSFWYKQKNYLNAGKSAIQLAQISNTSEAWGIAGTTLMAGLDESQEEEIKMQCKKLAVESLDKAIQLNGDDPQHQMNKALCWVKIPEGDPMKGIMSLVEIGKKYPDYIPVQITLSQLAIQTGQWDKAYNRLKSILEKDPKQVDANCLMLEVIRQSNRNENLEPYKRFCKE
ncbi:MAG: hypothetical protein IT267_05050 [Saprospiraceae bacterium]|nr:hypothetical protein [Saprospiraceae bacterium]